MPLKAIFNILTEPIKSSKKSIKKTQSGASSPWEDADSEDSSYLSDESEDLTKSRSSSKTTTHKGSKKAKSSRLGSAGSASSRKSASELLAEAQDIAGHDSLPIYKYVKFLIS